MKRFLRNITGSLFWKRTLAVIMAFSVLLTLVPASLTVAWTADTGTGKQQKDLIGDTSVELQQATLGAKWKDEDGNEVSVEMENGGDYQIPFDADIGMRLDFLLGDGNLVDGDTVYRYQLPDNVRVDVDEWYDLKNKDGDTVGRVHVHPSENGTQGYLDFEFYEDVVKDKKGIHFYVQFEGSFSGELGEEGKKADVEFPAPGGNFTFHIETQGSSKKEEEPELPDIGISKSGTVTEVDGKQYIVWNVYLNPNGRDNIDGDIVDILPEGLKYAEESGYPKITQNQWGNYGTVTATVNGQELTLKLSGTNSNGINVEFLTSYGDYLQNHINDGSNSFLIENTAAFNPDDLLEKSVEAKGTAYLTPHMLTKSAKSAEIQFDEVTRKYYIDWDIELNQDGMDLQNAKFEDIIPDGLGEPTVLGSLPAGASASYDSASRKWTVTFGSSLDHPNDKQNLHYRTYVDDDALNTASFVNNASLEVEGVKNDFTAQASVRGVDYLDKSIGYKDYDPITKTFRWTIVVNREKKELSNVVVTDSFKSAEMEFVSADVNGVKTTPTRSSSGDQTELKFNLGSIADTVEIHIVTKMKDDFESTSGSSWYSFVNHAKLTADSLPEFEDEANYTVDTEAEIPDFLSKSGQMNGDGTVTWTVHVQHVTNNALTMDFKDILPEGMTYVPDSFQIGESWAGNFQPRKAGYVDGSRTLTYTVDPSQDRKYMDDTNGFTFQYQTKVATTGAATTEGDFNNHAELTLNFENDLQVSDDADAKVSGRPGGVLDKDFQYLGGREVIWTVRINQARLSLNIDKPVIEDQLADYLDYVSGTLYLVDERENRTEVAQNQYTVTNINNKLIVQLPKITNQYYEFEFMTRFNPMYDTALKNETIRNTVTMYGKGETWQDASDTVQNVSFSQGSAGADYSYAIRIRKVDANDTNKGLAGARFSLKLNGVEVGAATSDADGWAYFPGMLSENDGYTFTLEELSAPSGYVKLDKPIEVKFSLSACEDYADGYHSMTITVENENANISTTGSVTVKKTDADGSPLAGAVFGIYSDETCTELVAQMEPTSAATDTLGKTTWEGLEAGTYYIKEITPPAGYKLNTTDIIKATLTKGSSGIETSYETKSGSGEWTSVSALTTPTIKNVKMKGSLVLKKVDETDGTKALSNAVFGLYTDRRCNDLIEQKTTGGDGTVTFENLEVGRTYYYREDTAPDGYLKDDTIHAVQIGTGTEQADVTIQETVTNKKAVGNIVVTKYGDDGKLLEGVVFTLYDKEGTYEVYKPDTAEAYTVTTDANGVARFEGLPFGDYTIRETTGAVGYTVASDTKIAVNQLGDTKVTVINNLQKINIKIHKTDGAGTDLAGAVFGLFTTNGLEITRATTNANGIAEFKDVPYGNYVVKELIPPAGYFASGTDQVIFTVNGGDFAGIISSGGTKELEATNTKQNGFLQFTKYDGGNNPLGGAEFALYDRMGKKVAEAESVVGTGKVSFTELPFGTYTLREIDPPAGYLRDTTEYTVVINSNDPVRGYYDEVNDPEHNTRIPYTFYNKKANPPFISFKLKKTDTHGMALEDAVFGFYCVGKNADGTDKLIADATTGKDGIAYFRRIPMTDYVDTDQFYVKEIKAPAGYEIGGTDSIIATFGKKDELSKFKDGEDDGSDTLIDGKIVWLLDSSEAASTIENAEIRGSIRIIKTGLTTLEPLNGAEFTLYEEDGVTIAKVDGAEVEPVTTASMNVDGAMKNGVALFENIPYGSYVIRETKAPAGYTLNPNSFEVDVTENGKVVEVGPIRDARINVSIDKKSVGGMESLPGAKLELHVGDANGEVIASWTSPNTKYTIPYDTLVVGGTYTLTEATPPAGYAYAKPVTFTIDDYGNITITSGTSSTSATLNGKTITMWDKPLELAVIKNDETDRPLSNAILSLWDNGTDNTKDEMVEEWTTGQTPHIITKSLVAPKTGFHYYTIKELSAPDGYLIADSIKIQVAPDGSIYHGGSAMWLIPGPLPTVTMQDQTKTAGNMYIRKMDGGEEVPLNGATFTIRDTDASSQITVASGDILNTDEELEAYTFTSKDDTMIKVDLSQLVESQVGNEHLYRLSEIDPPTGFSIAEPVDFKVIKNGGTLQVEYVSGNPYALNMKKDTFTVRDYELTLLIRKQNEFGLPITGARLQLSKYDYANHRKTDIVETFDTDADVEDYQIPADKLTVDQYYILEELSAPEGYNKADPIIFKINMDTSVVMLLGGKEIPVPANTIVMEDTTSGISVTKYDDRMRPLAGAELTITAVDDPTFTPITWTTTKETKAMDLYLFKAGCSYTITEQQAPDGYRCIDPITFTVSKDGTYITVNHEKQENLAVQIVDEKLKLTISKQDITNSAELPGAKLQVRDESGTLLYEFTSTEAPTQMPTEKFRTPAPGDGYTKYTLTEITAPEGYELAETITFAFDSRGDVYIVTLDANGNEVYTKTDDFTIVMQDAPKFSISKQDLAGEEVPGATLTITTTEDESFETITFVSGTKPTYLDQTLFKPGVTYTLTETAAPNGYAYAEQMTFMFDANGQLYVNGKLVANKQVVMVDDVLAVKISKQDITNSKELPGAKLQIQDANGTVIYEFTSSNTPTLIPKEVFTTPQPGSMAYYTLTEITAPDGYEVAETIYFALDSAGNVYVRGADGTYTLLKDGTVVMQDRPTNTSDQTNTTETDSNIAKVPKTGDTVRLQLAVFLGLCSMLMACIFLYKGFRK